METLFSREILKSSVPQMSILPHRCGKEKTAACMDPPRDIHSAASYQINFDYSNLLLSCSLPFLYWLFVSVTRMVTQGEAGHYAFIIKLVKRFHYECAMLPTIVMLVVQNSKINHQHVPHGGKLCSCSVVHQPQYSHPSSCVSAEFYDSGFYNRVRSHVCKPC